MDVRFFVAARDDEAEATVDVDFREDRLDIRAARLILPAEFDRLFEELARVQRNVQS